MRASLILSMTRQKSWKGMLLIRWRKNERADDEDERSGW